jgi:transcription elongation factor GreA
VRDPDRQASSSSLAPSLIFTTATRHCTITQTVSRNEEAAFFCAGQFAEQVNAMSEMIPMTRTGYEKIKAEMERMESVEMPIITKRIADARAEGDLSENAEYHGARESQGMLQAKINLLKEKLARATIVDPSKLPKDEVVFGCTVIVKDLDFGDEETFILVGAGEEDYDEGKILVTSPLAQGLLSKKVGDKVEVEVPKGTMSFEILEIKWE